MAEPKAGDFLDGYRFKGGDPSKQDSWEAVDVPRIGHEQDGYRFKGGDPIRQESWEPLRNYSLGEALEAAPGNLGSSAMRRLGELGEAGKQLVSDPVHFITNLGKVSAAAMPHNIMAYTAMQAAALTAPEDQAKVIREHANKLIEPLQPLFEDYAQAYGGWDKIKRTIAEDPTRVLSDVAALALPAEGVPGKVGAVAKGAQMMDPATLALTGAGKVAKYGARPLNEIMGGLTGTSEASVVGAYKAGREGGTKQSDFARALSGDMSGEEIVDVARQGTRNMRDAMSMTYNQQKLGPWGWAQNQAMIPKVWNDIDNTVNAAHDTLFKTYGTQKHSVLSAADQAKWQGVLDTIKEWRSNPASHTIEGLDDLKQAIRNQLTWTDRNRNLRRAVTQATNGITDALATHAGPVWGDAMKDYARASKIVSEIEDDFALNGQKGAQRSLGKLQKAMRNNAYSQQGALFQNLEALEKQGGVNLQPALAGQALNTWVPRGLHGRGMLGLELFGTLAHPPAWPAALGAAAITSPKVVGSTYNLLGRAARASRTPIRVAGHEMPSLAETLGTAFGRPGRAAQRVYGGAYDEPKERARGGRLAFSRHT